MAKITVKPDCGNAPRKLFLKDVHISLAEGEAALMIENAAEGIVWEFVGGKTVKGKADFAEAVKQQVSKKVDELLIRSIITHGKEAAVSGDVQLANGSATWSFTSDKPATGTINIKNSTGATVYSGTFPLSAGSQALQWDGRSNNGTLNADGAYTMSITAKDASGSTVAISTEVHGTVDSVDLTQNPPVLSIGGQNFTLDKIKNVVRSGLT